MADGAALTNYQNWLYELQGTAQRLFAAEYVLLAELSGLVKAANGAISYDPQYERMTRAMDGNREVFDGSSVRFPLLLAGLGAGGTVAETGTWNAPVPMDTSKANVNLGRVLQPMSLSIDLQRDSSEGRTSAMSAMSLYTSEAYKAVARIENDMAHGNGDALLSSITGGSSPGLTITVGTAANFDQLTPGRIVDVLTKSNGANPGNGLRRKITSTSRSAGTVTFSTTAQASDGSSGNITFSTSEGIYIPGSYGTALQGLTQAVAVTGTFEGVDKAAVQQWQGIDATPSAAAALSDAMLDNATYLLRGQGVGASDFGIAHPKTLDLYKSGKQSQVRYTPQDITMQSGFRGIEYDGADQPFPLLKDLAAPRGMVRLIKKDAVRLYGDHVGPGFLDNDGGTQRYFNRNLAPEMDLLDRVQVCFTACNRLASIGNATTLLTEAS